MAAEKLTLTVQEAADALGISKPTLYQIIHSEGFPSFKIGSRVVISRAGLEKWVLEQASKGVI